MAGSAAVSALARAAGDYLELRRALGYKLRQEGRLVASLAGYLRARGLDRVTVTAALAWATRPEAASPAWHAKRLAAVRGFAAYLATINPASQIIPRGLLPARASRSTPYLYSPAQIQALMAAAARLSCPLRAATFEAFIGLMAATGLRTGEAMALDRADADLSGSTLIIRCAKLGKSRLVPLHETSTAALARYAARRDHLCPQPATAAFFLSGAGTRLNHTNVSTTFAGLLAAAGISAAPGTRRPRLYDLRHTFAVTTLASWHAEAADAQARLPVLATYLGHVKPSSTYWYLQAEPQLLAAAANRLEGFLGDLS
jgi:integrase/recombinase XerD